MESAMEIDDSLYSRQRYVLGDNAMHRMAASKVFLYRLGGLGVEIAKNIVLAGVKSLTLYDPSPASMMDLSSQFFLRESDVTTQANRADASQSRLAELNPYVTVKVSSQPLSLTSDLEFLRQYQCVVLTDASLHLQTTVNNFCRKQSPPVNFISCSVRGVFSSVFCDFGQEFTIFDNNGEEPIECFIANITKSNPGVVTCMENTKHNLETGDTVTFKEVVGMTTINDTTHKVKVLSPTEFAIGDTSGDDYHTYQHGGIARQVKLPKTVSFESLEKQLPSPQYIIADFAKMEAPLQIHVAMLALDQFMVNNQRTPRPRNAEDAETMLKLASEVNSRYKLVESVDGKMVGELSWTAAGLFPPLATAIGGLVAQETLISLTGKFSPLRQWLFLDATEVLADSEQCDHASFQPCGDRYDGVRVCLGEQVLQKLAKLKLFMVGCGAIGCELLKNYAMLGVARKPDGLLTITDNDLIEKSNLNRQFLFRPHHIQQPKSVVASKSTLDINPDLCIDAQQYKVFPGTEKDVYHNGFFQRQDLVVNALDNVEARRYVDGRCVTNLRPLLESGTMGAKGHVQVIVPHQTESYSSQTDPPDRDVPYCTLKSFPATIEHTIQWARDKFESLFSQRPSMFTKFWESHSPPDKLLGVLREGGTPDGVVKVVKLLKSRPLDWHTCLQLGRVKFEKYFHHRALKLLNAFPLDTKMKDGSLFWQSPKRPPKPIIFDINDPLHTSFVVSFARLYAAICGVPYSQQDLSPDSVSSIVLATPLPSFKPSSKKIVTDESVKKPVEEEMSSDLLEICTADLGRIISTGTITQDQLKMTPQSFEKDDDSNGHIDFITASSNLRAMMYAIDPVDRFKTKLIAGRIVPAIATTTAAVAGLVSIELVKVVMQLPSESLKNCFLSLALPSVVFSEPAPPIPTVINDKLTFTLWDKWEVKGHKTFKLQDFLKAIKESYNLEPSMVVMGVKMIYVPWMPGHRKRLTQTMVQLIKPSADKEYVDLTVSFASADDEGDDSPGPPIRYYFK